MGDWVVYNGGLECVLQGEKSLFMYFVMEEGHRDIAATDHFQSAHPFIHRNAAVYVVQGHSLLHNVYRARV